MKKQNLVTKKVLATTAALAMALPLAVPFGQAFAETPSQPQPVNVLAEQVNKSGKIKVGDKVVNMKETYIIYFEDEATDAKSKEEQKAKGIKNDHVKGYVKAAGGEILNEGKELHFVVAQFPNEKAAKAIENKKGIKSINQAVEREFVGLPSGWSETNANTAEGTGWGYDKIIGDMKSRGLNLNGDTVEVLVSDLGFDADHPDLGSNFKGALDSYDPNANGHGSAVVGIIGAADNTIGTVGVAPGARLWHYDVSSGWGVSDIATVMAIDWAMVNGIDIVNMSYGGNFESTGEKNAIAEAQATRGMMFVAGAGNNATDNRINKFYPAQYPGVVTVGGVEKDASGNIIPWDSDNTSGGTNYGEIDLTAPTEVATHGNVHSTSSEYAGKYYLKSFAGTSGATPHVTAAAALYKQIYPHYSDAQLQSKMKADAENIGLPSTYQGSGLVSAPKVDTGIRESNLTHGAKLYTANSTPTRTYGQAFNLYSRLMDDPTTVSGTYERSHEKPFEGATIRYGIRKVGETAGTYTTYRTTGTNGRFDMTLPVNTTIFPTKGDYIITTRYTYIDPVTGQHLENAVSQTVTIN